MRPVSARTADHDTGMAASVLQAHHRAQGHGQRLREGENRSGQLIVHRHGAVSGMEKRSAAAPSNESPSTVRSRQS